MSAGEATGTFRRRSARPAAACSPVRLLACQAGALSWPPTAERASQVALKIEFARQRSFARTRTCACTCTRTCSHTYALLEWALLAPTCALSSGSRVESSGPDLGILRAHFTLSLSLASKASASAKLWGVFSVAFILSSACTLLRGAFTYFRPFLFSRPGGLSAPPKASEQQASSSIKQKLPARDWPPKTMILAKS